MTRLTGVAYSTLNHWAKTGLVTPSISRGTGSGTERIYSSADLVVLKVAHELRKCGIPTRSLQAVIDFLQREECAKQPLSGARLIVSDGDVFLVRDEHDLVSVLKTPGQRCLSFIIDLPTTIRDVVEAVESPETIAFGLQDEPVVNVHRKQPQSVHSETRGKHSATRPR
ncbi:MAG: MerR family transcriptional regulator [Terriglobales bacterium]